MLVIALFYILKLFNGHYSTTSQEYQTILDFSAARDDEGGN